MKFSETLKKLRQEQNLTQDDLADKIFVTRTAISKWKPTMDIQALKI